MEVKQKNDSKKGMFYIEQDEKIVAEMTYVWAGTEKIIINHTEVNEILKGQGAGKQMLSKAVEFVRENGLKIIPLCPFVKSVFDKKPEYDDVL
ncbi:acetyltransferase, GNAT family [Aquipluma nitroreducens]|uniref:Acetyltransferase, GNAT family n=1 Tax=Aquipluma nitroreducens TaxID=2010828 RepID=A0A5K7S8Z8_9BACT|nr:GNAT family N-acetyltransferase [Aquipluma nitroreducens]BBE18038.1 acetyltransferase, GNAT family [Aquipluma nitroreducens]